MRGCGGLVTSYDVGTLIYCTDGLTLHDNQTGANSPTTRLRPDRVECVGRERDPVHGRSTDKQPQRRSDRTRGQLWSVGLPAGFTASSSFADDPFFNPVSGHVAAAFDHRLLIGGHVAGGRPALVVLTDLPFTPPVQPVLTLDDITSSPDVAGFVGPYTMPDGAKVVVLARGDQTGLTDSGGTVELAVERADGWHIEQVIDQPTVSNPVEVGDLTGDGLSEIVVTSPAPTGGKSWDYLYRLDANGPKLIEIPFVLGELGPDVSPTMLQITAVSPDHVTATIVQCKPNCAEDPGLAADFVLDRTGTWSLHPTQPAPPATPSAQTVCIRSNIDFAALRAAPDLAADLLAQIPPGSCDVTLVDRQPVDRERLRVVPRAMERGRRLDRQVEYRVTDKVPSFGDR